jgi:hypothetical protein
MSRPDDPFGIIWLADFRMKDERWANRAELLAIAEAFAATGWWDEIDFVGRHSKPGEKFETTDELADFLLAGGQARNFLAAGSPKAAMMGEGSDCYVKIDVMGDGWLTLGAGASGGGLARLGRRAADDFIELVVTLRDRWKGRGHLDHALMRPIGGPAVTFPRARPRRTSDWLLEAIVDIVDPTFEPYDDKDWRVPLARALAEASPPPPATRQERDGVVIIRWVDDPSNAEAAMRGARSHEAWIATVLPTQVAEGWNERGDERVPSPFQRHSAAPFDLWDPQGHVGFVILPASAPASADAAAYARLPELMRSPAAGDDRLPAAAHLVLPSRERALTLAGSRIRPANRALYEEAGRFWDPRPPGNWFEPPE